MTSLYTVLSRSGAALPRNGFSNPSWRLAWVNVTFADAQRLVADQLVPSRYKIVPASDVNNYL